MRLTPPAVAVAVLASLAAAAAPAAAAEWTVGAVDYEFQPPELQIAPGDTVTWSFVNGGHTATSARGQAERWDSGSAAAGQRYPHTFETPGRYQYICVPHEAFDMKGVITVGADAVAKSVSRFKAKRTRNRVKVSFRLNEAAAVTYRLKGAARRSVKRGRLAAGRRSFTVRRLKRGRYTGTLAVVDDFDKKQTAKSTFRVR